MIMMKKFSYSLLVFSVILAAFVMVSNSDNVIPFESNKVQYSANYNHSAIQFSESYALIESVSYTTNQATNFNHIKQLRISYFFIGLIALFIVLPKILRNYNRAIIPLPWYLTHKHNPRKLLISAKLSNLLYKSKLHYYP